MKTFVIVLIAAAVAATCSSCDSTVTPGNNFTYAKFTAGPPVNKSYNPTSATTSRVNVFDSSSGTVVTVLKFTSWGLCSCGSSTEKLFFICDTNGRAWNSPADSGSLGFKVVGELTEAFSHGRVMVDSMMKDLTGYTVYFRGRAKVGADSVDLTGGVLVAQFPPMP